MNTDIISLMVVVLIFLSPIGLWMFMTQNRDMEYEELYKKLNNQNKKASD